MDDEKYIRYLTDFISLLDEQEREAKSDADNMPEKEFVDYNQGHLMAYHSVISLLKHQAFVFNMEEKELGLANMDI